MIFLHRQSREPYRFPADHRSESRLSIPQRGALQCGAAGAVKTAKERVRNNETPRLAVMQAELCIGAQTSPFLQCGPGSSGQNSGDGSL
jgi:hypothetical protein